MEQNYNSRRWAGTSRSTNYESSVAVRNREDALEDEADQMLINQWLKTKGNKVEVCEYNTRTEEEDIVYHWKKNKVKAK
jgi:hypothetical protein|tara:strand:- start:985 stop:1221 length:237 start_codon:yes stop_codon:yes gene_type:complete